MQKNQRVQQIKVLTPIFIESNLNNCTLLLPSTHFNIEDIYQSSKTACKSFLSAEDSDSQTTCMEKSEKDLKMSNFPDFLASDI